MEFHQCRRASLRPVMLRLITCLVLLLVVTGVDAGVTSAQGQTFTIFGRITETTPLSGPPIVGVTVTLTTNTAAQRTTQTNATGDFSFANVAAGSSFEVTPSKAGFVFQPVSQGGTNLSQNVQFFFTGQASSAPPLQLILEESGPGPAQVVALESPFFTRDPFLFENPANVLAAADGNTRVIIFVKNLQLASGESAASVVVNLVDSLNQNHNIPAESVQPLTDFTQVIFRLPDNLPAGSCSIKVIAHSTASNIGTFRIKT